VEKSIKVAKEEVKGCKLDLNGMAAPSSTPRKRKTKDKTHESVGGFVPQKGHQKKRAGDNDDNNTVKQKDGEFICGSGMAVASDQPHRPQ
jgi:hypothetical protein